MLKATVITSTLWVFGAILSAQPQPVVTFTPVVKGMVLPDVECSEFHSRFTGHDYHVYVSLPASYGQGDQRYPVLYVPDAVGEFLFIRGAYVPMSFVNMLEEFILVGVPLKLVGVPVKLEGRLDWLRKRAFDLTPTDVEA
jgi:predicted alpha/beta superfamily hydrolase